MRHSRQRHPLPFANRGFASDNGPADRPELESSILENSSKTVSDVPSEGVAERKPVRLRSTGLENEAAEPEMAELDGNHISGVGEFSVL